MPKGILGAQTYTLYVQKYLWYLGAGVKLNKKMKSMKGPRGSIMYFSFGRLSAIAL